ncbi:MAG: glycosyl hydrolase family 8 [Polyangia bacterium]
MFQPSISPRHAGNVRDLVLATWNVTRWLALGAGMLLVLWSCNSHSFSGLGPSVTILPPEEGGSTGTTSASATNTGNPFGGQVSAAGMPASAGGSIAAGGDTIVAFGGTTTNDAGAATGGQPSYDAAVPPPIPDAPIVETYSCPPGTVRIHVRDIWSTAANPTMGTMTTAPLSVLIINPTGSWPSYGARQDTGNCSWYSVCAPNTLTKFEIKPVGADACGGTSNASGTFDASSLIPSKNEIWLDYTGPSSSVAADYQTAAVGTQHFRLTSDKTAVSSEACPQGQPDETVPSGYIKVHFRYPWADPQETGFAGSACAESKLGYDVPPYPTSLKVTGLACEMQAMLEFQDGQCPWYYVLIPTKDWTSTANITFRYPDDSLGLWTPNLPLPALTSGVTEYWIGYAGAPDNTAASIPTCMDWSQDPLSYFFYTANPGPGYANCGGSTKPVDPCSPPLPNGFHTVHFRYIWAGQKTFTYFPNTALMPPWMELEVSSNKVICFREADRPWYNCPVPDKFFVAGATWRAVDKTHNPEWNTVSDRPFQNPDPTWLPAGPLAPGEYWLRWEYGKPDIPSTSLFRFFDYYPDATNGDWSSMGNWNDSACAPKPPATPVNNIGFGGWFPYASTNYLYPNGGSLAFIYPNVAAVQDLFNAFVYDRYLIFRANYVTSTDTVCGPGTARIKTNPPKTVSEGQGYGMAIAAAIGDKATFDSLWNFVRHFLSQAADKYCGGLMGWMWDGTIPCRALDSPCDPAKESCSGNEDSAFDGDVDIGIGLVYAALQWPEYTQYAISWLLKMECEVDTNYDNWNYPTSGDTGAKNCQNYPGQPCAYGVGDASPLVHMDYYPPGYFRVFGDFLAANLPTNQYADIDRKFHHDFWYKTAQTVYVMLERCYNQAGLQHGFVGFSGSLDAPCRDLGSGGVYEWERFLWRVSIDAAWFGNNTSLPEAAPNSSQYESPKSKMQAEIDHIQDYFNTFYVNNPVEANANRFSSICDSLGPDGTVKNCDPAYGHNSYTVNMAMCAYVSSFNDGGATTLGIRQEAIEESISTTVENDAYLQEPLGVYSMLFLTGNFPNPMTVPPLK